MTKNDKKEKAEKKDDKPKPIKNMAPQEFPEELKELKVKLDKFTKKVLEKFDKYIMGVSLLPPTKDKKDQVNVLVVVDDADSTKMNKLELKEKLTAIIKEIGKKTDPNFNIDVIITSELWQNCNDGRYEQLDIIAMSQPVFDKGVLSGIKLSEIHKKMSLEKFERYIVCYVAAGSHFRGEGHEKSDIDVFVVIDDTDVKKMSRFELKEKLTAIMYDMAFKAAEITGIKIKLHVQTYLLTDFWDSIKDANPVIFTFLRDGIPFFDRGIYMPWKMLLRMGKIKPSAESIDMFVNSGEQFLDRAKKKILMAGVEDAYYAILNPSQAALMIYGLNPSTPRETAKLIQEIFVDKEKILEQEYADIIHEQVLLWKSFEYDEVKKLDGAKAQKLIDNVDRYLKRIKKLYEQIEQQKMKETVLHIYDSVMAASRDVLKVEGKTDISNDKMIETFEKTMVNFGKFPQKTLKVLQGIVKAKDEYDKSNMTKQDVENIRKDGTNYIKFMAEYLQRKRARELERSKIRLRYENKFAEVILLDEEAYIIHDLQSEQKEVSKAKFTKEGGLENLTKSDIETFEKALADAKFSSKVSLTTKTFDALREIFGKEVEVLVTN